MFWYWSIFHLIPVIMISAASTAVKVTVLPEEANVTVSPNITLPRLYEGYNASNLLDKLLKHYDNRLRPDFGGPPTLVDVNLNIRSMGPITERDMTYQMDCYFRQTWVDKRLVFEGPMETMGVGIKVLDLLWKPDTHFINGKRSLLHTVTSPNKLLRINQKGEILYSMRLTVKASCPMHLENFPMDTQTCPLQFGSHGYDTGDLVYRWTYGPDKSIKMATDMALSQFDLIGFAHTNENISHIRQGQYSMLSVQFTLRRHMGYFLINVYVPCSLLVICSWVGFWINREATSDRIALGVTTVLTMAFLKIDNRMDLPEVSYSTALDYFLGTCFTLVLATIIEFAGVHYFTKHGSGEVLDDSDSEAENDEAFAEDAKAYNSCHRRRSYSSLHRRSTNRDNNGKICSNQAISNDRLVRLTTNENCCYKFWNCVKGSSEYQDIQKRRPSSNFSSGTINSVSKIDKACRVVFPLIFSLFNGFYWSMYIVWEENNVML